MSKLRRSIEIDDFNHGGQPIPAASRVGNLIVSGGIYGLDSTSGTLPDDVGDQTRLMFLHMGRILEAAGIRYENVARMTFYVKDPAARGHVNMHWETLFPEQASRPARHTLSYDGLPANMLVQCDFIAIADD
ncbi:MAG: RidA family protein [Thermomicrobiales bacterium]